MPIASWAISIEGTKKIVDKAETRKGIKERTKERNKLKYKYIYIYVSMYIYIYMFNSYKVKKQNGKMQIKQTYIK